MSATAAELQQNLLQTRSELQSVKAQISYLRRNDQLASVTQAQVHEETAGPTNARVWQSVGKMFMAVSVDEYDKDVEKRKAELQERMNVLSKKETYFATTLEKLTDAITAAAPPS